MRLSLPILLFVLTAFGSVAIAQQKPKNTTKSKNDVSSKKVESQATKTPGTAETTNGPTPPPSKAKAPDAADKAFMKDAAIGNMAEIELGHMAEEKGANQDVKQFGTRMVNDHSSAGDLLKTIAQSQHVSLPVVLDPAHKNEKARLSKLTGNKFDKAYARTMVQNHTKTIDKFKHEAQFGHDAEVKKYAQETLPTLQSHLKAAKDMEQKVTGSKK